MTLDAKGVVAYQIRVRLDFRTDQRPVRQMDFMSNGEGEGRYDHPDQTSKHWQIEVHGEDRMDGEWKEKEKESVCGRERRGGRREEEKERKKSVEEKRVKEELGRAEGMKEKKREGEEGR